MDKTPLEKIGIVANKLKSNSGQLVMNNTEILECGTILSNALLDLEGRRDLTALKLHPQPKMSEKYPAYFKDFSGDDEADVYLIHHKFGISDPAGCIHHASKKLLLSGVRTGGKSKYQDIKEARDTLNRWLQINQENCDA